MKHAHIQWAFANEKVKNDTFANNNANKIPHKDKVQTIIMDYCQNLNLSHLGEDQSGYTFYCSTLSIFYFGICDAVSNHLSVCVYNENKGGKGEYNVAHLLLQPVCS